MKTKLILILMFNLYLIAGCATIYNPLTGKKDYIYQGLDTNWEVSVGKEVSLDMEKRYPINNDSKLNERLNNIGKKIVAVCDRKDLKYTFKIIDNKELNAFAIFGGHIYVFKGAILKLSSDDELASLIAHEVGHVVERHLAKQLQSEMGYSVLSGIALRLIYKEKEPSVELVQAMNAAYKVVGLGYSRHDETEADRLGVRYVKFAGFRPNSMIDLLKKVEEESKSAPLPERLIQNITIIRSHPQTNERIKAVEKEIKALSNTAEANYHN